MHFKIPGCIIWLSIVKDPIFTCINDAQEMRHISEGCENKISFCGIVCTYFIERVLNVLHTRGTFLNISSNETPPSLDPKQNLITSYHISSSISKIVVALVVILSKMTVQTFEMFSNSTQARE